MKKPTLKKHPKKPKKSASLETVKNYIQKCREIDRENKKKISDYHKTKKLLSKIYNK